MAITNGLLARYYKALSVV